MRIAIVGSSGYIAGHLIHTLTGHEVVKIGRTDADDFKLDLNAALDFNYQNLERVDYLIFTAAISGPDKCANEFDACWKVNVDGTRHFIRQALDRGVKVLFLSSDAVFGDIPGYIYNEESSTQAATPYGKMKKAVEDEFKSEKLFKCLRLAYVVSAYDKFVSYCLNCMRSGQRADVFHPFYRNCITLSDVIKAIHWLLANWDAFSPFALNLAGEELVSRVRIADEINRIFSDNLKYSISQPAEGFYQNRPRITQMRSLYLYNHDILERSTFTEKFYNELKDIRL